MNVAKRGQLEKHGFGSLHNLTWSCYHNEENLLRNWVRFTNEVESIFPNSLLRIKCRWRHCDTKIELLCIVISILALQIIQLTINVDKWRRVGITMGNGDLSKFFLVPHENRYSRILEKILLFLGSIQSISGSSKSKQIHFHPVHMHCYQYYLSVSSHEYWRYHCLRLRGSENSRSMTKIIYITNSTTNRTYQIKCCN